MNKRQIYYQVAIFVHKSEEYVMRPDHCLLDVGREMKFKLAKVKRNHILDSHSLKSGNEGRIF